MANKVIITISGKSYRVVGNPLSHITKEVTTVKSVAFGEGKFKVEEVNNG